MLSLVAPAQRVPKTHPLRRIEELADGALTAPSPTVDQMNASGGRPSVPPERLLKSTLRMALYSVRSDRLFCEQLDYNLLFRWFLDMDMVEESFNHSTFSKNRERLVACDVAKRFLGEIVRQARSAGLMSDDHFTVDGTLIEAWASLKSFRPKGEKPENRPPPDDPGNPTVNFHGEKRGNETHQSTTGPESKLYRKSKAHEAKLNYCGNVLMETRNGLIVDFRIEQAGGFAERDAALAILDECPPNQVGATVGADAGYDIADFVAACRERGITPHVAQTTDKRRRSAIDGRTVRHPGYEISQRIRKRGRRDLRLDQDGRVVPKDPVQRSRPHAARRPLRRCRVQPAQDLKAGSRVVRPRHPASPPAEGGGRGGFKRKRRRPAGAFFNSR